MFRGLAWGVVVLALSSCGGSAGSMLAAAGDQAGAVGSDSGAPAVSAGGAGAENTGGEAGKASSAAGAAHGGEASAAGEGGAIETAGTGGATVGGQGGGAPMAGGAGIGGAPQGGTGGGAGQSGGSGSAGAPACECSTGYCCDGCHLRPDAYVVDEGQTSAVCIGDKLQPTYQNQLCTGQSATALVWGPEKRVGAAITCFYDSSAVGDPYATGTTCFDNGPGNALCYTP